MKVNELVSELLRFDQELPVLAYAEDQILVAPDHMFRLLEIDSIDTSEGERRKGDDGVATLKLGKGPLSERFALITVTSDF